MRLYQTLRQLGPPDPGLLWDPARPRGPADPPRADPPGGIQFVKSTPGKRAGTWEVDYRWPIVLGRMETVAVYTMTAASA